jgi:hypothetical protein
MKGRYLWVFCLLNIANAFAAEKSWFKSFGGKIGPYPITLNLHMADGKVSGVYYYESKQQPVALSGTIDKKNQILLTGSPSIDLEETFTLKLTNEVALNGIWATLKSKLKVDALQKKNIPFDVTTVYTSEQQLMFKEKPEAPIAEIFLGSVWVSGSSALAKKINEGIIGFYEKKTFKEIGKYFIEAKKDFFSAFHSNKSEAKAEPSTMWNRAFDSKTEIQFVSSDLLSLRNFVYEYSGGAHGNYGVSFYNFSLKTQKKLSLNDVLSKPRQKELSKLLESKLRENYQLKPKAPLTEVLFEDKINYNNNFYITEKGIGFLYNPYEISAYAMGIIDLYIPFSSFKNK